MTAAVILRWLKCHLGARKLLEDTRCCKVDDATRAFVRFKFYCHFIVASR